MDAISVVLPFLGWLVAMSAAHICRLTVMHHQFTPGGPLLEDREYRRYQHIRNWSANVMVWNFFFFMYVWINYLAYSLPFR